MSSYLSDNDDDLFDYDPHQDVAPKADRTADSAIVETPTQSAYEREFIDNVKNGLHADPDADLDPTSPKINGAMSNLYGSFGEAVHGFINSMHQDHFTKSVHLTLDSLTEGRFSLLNMFHFYEMKLMRKIALVNLFGNIFVDDSETISPFLQEISAMLNVNVTHLYYRATFRSTISILTHSVMVDRLIYQYLADKTGMETKSILISDLNDVTAEQIHAEISKIELTGFHRDLHSQILAAFLTGNGDGPTILATTLQESFNAPIKYLNSYQTM